MSFRLFPVSVFPATEGKVYPDVYATTSNSFLIEALGVIASLSADAELHYVFRVPASLPSGTAKLEVLAMAPAVAGAAKFNPKWKSVAVEDDMDLAAGSLNAEGTQTLTWSTGDDDQFKSAKVTLDADTVVADEFIVLRLVMETSSWTLAEKSIWLPTVIWE